MKIVASAILPYRRTMPRAIETSHGRYQDRTGFLLLVRDEIGNVGVGDAAPLPGLSPEGLYECERSLQQLTLVGRPQEPVSEIKIPISAAEYFLERRSVTARSRSFLERLEVWFSESSALLSSLAPSALFAAATALGELKSKRKKLSLCRAMNAKSASTIAVNGLITERQIAAIITQVKSLELAGYTRLKMKVGLDHPGDDIARIDAACQATSTSLLRLDANCGWDMRWAEAVLSSIPRNRVEFIEQPFPRGQWGESRRLADKYHVRLALDEDVQTLTEAETHINDRTCDVLVFKPMIIGRLYECVLLAKKAQKAGIEIIYTSSWESDVGLTATLHLAAAIGPNPPAVGLSTAGMISQGLVNNPLKIENGHLKVPEGPGLGLELAPEILGQLK